jgi:hypothetical protein
MGGPKCSVQQYPSLLDYGDKMVGNQVGSGSFVSLNLVRFRLVWYKNQFFAVVTQSCLNILYSVHINICKSISYSM